MDDYQKRDDSSYSSSSKNRDDGYKSSRSDSYKTSGGGVGSGTSSTSGVRDDYKRDVERHSGSSSSYITPSSRMDVSSSSLNKDRYSDRATTTSDYRSSSRNDDIRNGSSKSSSRFYDSQAETRYDRPAPPAPSAWTSSLTHQQFSAMNPPDIWTAKQQQQDSGNGWNRGNLDDSRSGISDYRFGGSGSDRKTSSNQQFIDASRSNQYMGGSSSLMQSAQRFGNSNSHNARW